MLACASMGAPKKPSYSPGLGAPWGEAKARARKHRRGRGPKEAYPVGKRQWALGHRERGFLG